MGAPLGFKTFATGDVLTAADTNGYLMQGVWAFASAAARTAAVTSPQEGNMSYLKDTDSTEFYNGSAWVSINSKIKQLVSATKTDTFTLSTQTFTDITGLSVTITPSSTSSTIFVGYSVTGNGGGTAMNIRAVRGSTAIGVATSTSSRTAMGSQLYNTDAGTMTSASWTYLDSPATTSATTYKVQVGANVSATTVYINRTPTDTDNSLFPRTVSSIWAMEIGA
jgi:hypothetical protein